MVSESRFPVRLHPATAPSGMGGRLIARARRRAGLTQKELAHRLETSQSLVARWENGAVAPSFDAVLRAVRACGLDLNLSLTTYDHEHDQLIDQNLQLAPAQRLKRMVSSRNAILKLKRSARRVDAST